MSKKKLILLSYVFSPSIGGIETVSLLVARSLAQRGFQVTVLTRTPSNGPEPDEPFRVLRSKSVWQLVRELFRADLVLQSHFSLKMGWPLWLLFPFKPFLLVMHGQVQQTSGRLLLRDRFKRLLLSRARLYSVSAEMARRIHPHCQVLHNPYDAEVFRRQESGTRESDLLFVGRLVKAKGCEVLLRAMPQILAARPQTRLAIVGSGKEEDALRRQASALGLQEKVSFLGSMRGEALAGIMNQHKVLAVPSISQPPEICPVVPIEAMACGCVPVASLCGGMADSVGPGGLLVEEGNPHMLATEILRLLESEPLRRQLQEKAQEHLRKYHPTSVAMAYETALLTK
ncbi:glycosyltransferase family 4 protein [Telmatobacter bradus]|uniref:glycosyltransferase family 4 protein n=1 Tax=Telmatobacter bradus TaxID=474953 RepID=UPI003B439DA0